MVLYVCAERSATMPGLAARRAEEEGRAYARDHGLTITEVVTDRFGVPDPCRREGWQQVRALAKDGVVAAVLVRWPAAIAPESASDCRHREADWLAGHGVRLHYTWEPMAAKGGGVR
ncbi:hypothetical protein ACIO6T_30620 [Streptomyces sp. NPDC087532]|uniref:hypothetical protein n=1 Tax=Streptomyces sp. NPDC087532 TaxID=3365795 RepID=UPI003811B5EF